MTTVRKSLYQRLPEIYRIKDEEQIPPGQLQAYLDILDHTQASIRDNIESLYHDFFIESCHDWVIPYLADALGVSHLAGAPQTLRADVARTIKHRRRKGTLGAIESLTHSLSFWAVHTVELRDRIVWNQHLNHQRRDYFGEAPLPQAIDENRSIGGPVQGGTINLRDPSQLSFYQGPFDPFAKVIDLKPITVGAARHNFPNLAVFMWRLKDYSLPVIRPSFVKNERFAPLPEALPAGDAEFVVGVNCDPLGRPMVLFNSHRYRADDNPPNLSHPDAVPGPMPMARLSEDTPTGNPEAYVEIVFYSAGNLPSQLTDDRVGLTLYLPDSLSGADWKIRGANLCAWQDGLSPNIQPYEIVVDPVHGRILFGVNDATLEADVIEEGVFISPTYGFSGPTGAHPIARKVLNETVLRVDFDSIVDEAGTTSPAANGSGLAMALADLAARGAPLIIEIQDSRTYDLDINTVSGAGTELGLVVLRLQHSLHIRAAPGQRPIIRLTRPLAFRPQDVSDAGVDQLNVVLEGLFMTWDNTSPEFLPDTPLIARAAVNQLVIEDTTLDPGNYKNLAGIKQASRYALGLTNDYGFDPIGGEDFTQTPQLTFTNAISGPLAVDSGYQLNLTNTIVDAASGVGDNSPALVIHAASGDPELAWGPALTIVGTTLFGRTRVTRASGEGGIFIHALQVHDDLIGCIHNSYFSGLADKLPQHQACVFGTQVSLSFASENFGEHAYAQLRLRSDRKILEQGPQHDAMGAFGYLLNTHKWKNLTIRYREFMPVGVQPVLIPVT